MHFTTPPSASLRAPLLKMRRGVSSCPFFVSLWARLLKMRRGVLSWAFLALSLCVSAANAQVPAKCFVSDPELQGSYVGGCKDGKAQGQGRAEGSAAYVGEFHQGKKHGRGVKTWPWGDRYEGGFANDTRNGFGLYVWASGDAYAGPWKDDAVAGRATPMMIARFRATTESLAAMAKPGVKLCSEASLGSKERTEGETQAVNQNTRQVAVKATKIGSTPLVVAGTRVAPGEVVWDDPLNWIPCN